MSIKIAAVCDNSLLGMALKKAGEECGVEVNYEAQYEDSIVDKLSSKTINSSDLILFVTDREIEQIEEIEERQHASGFYAFQDTMEMWRNER